MSKAKKGIQMVLTLHEPSVSDLLLLDVRGPVGPASSLAWFPRTYSLLDPRGPGYREVSTVTKDPKIVNPDLLNLPQDLKGGDQSICTG